MAKNWQRRLILYRFVNYGDGSEEEDENTIYILEESGREHQFYIVDFTLIV